MTPLPKKQERTEAKLGPRIAKRIQKIHPHPNWGLEIKTKGKKPSRHQEAALKQVEDGVFLYKPPDQGARNPFDYIHLGDADAIVCTIEENKRDVSCIVNGYYAFNIRV